MKLKLVAPVLLFILSATGGVRAVVRPVPLDAKLSIAAKRVAIQADQYRLSREIGSDNVGASVFSAVDTAGKRSVVVLLPKQSGLQSHLRKWFFDYERGTYKVLEITGPSDAGRVFQEYRKRFGYTGTLDQVQSSITRSLLIHASRLSRFTSPTSDLDRGGPGRVVRPARSDLRSDEATNDSDLPDAVATDETTREYCSGTIDYFLKAEDPFPFEVDVAKTQYGLSFDGGSYVSYYGPFCDSKGAEDYYYPFDTEWNTLECFPSGYENEVSGQFDLNGYSFYHNSDFGWNDLDTYVLLVGGLQYDWLFNPYMQIEVQGEASSLIHLDDDNISNYVCFAPASAPAQASSVGRLLSRGPSFLRHWAEQR